MFPCRLRMNTHAPNLLDTLPEILKVKENAYRTSFSCITNDGNHNIISSTANSEICFVLKSHS